MGDGGSQLGGAGGEPGGGPGGELGGGPGDLERWVSDARARLAADSRVRERWLRAQADDEASLTGALLALAEWGDAVVVTTVAGRRHRGVLTGVGIDFVALAAGGQTLTLVALHALGQVRAGAPGRGARSNAGPARSIAATPEGTDLGARMLDVLAQAAGQRPRLAVSAGAEPVVGELRAVGADVLVMQPDGAAGLAYVRVASVSEVSFLASG